MARNLRAGNLDTRSARLKLPVAKKPVYRKIGPGVGLGYRRNQTAGTWVVRVANGKSGNRIKALGVADDFQDADGLTVFDYWQAQDRARAIARSAHAAAHDARPLTVAEALDRYEADLKSRKGDPANVARVRIHIPESLGAKSIFMLTTWDLRGWRDRLAKEVAPATVNRTATCLKAALNAAADHDEGILTRRAWEIGLTALPDAEESRNVILDESEILSLIENAYLISAQFGLLVETAAVTGARISQLARLKVENIQPTRAEPRLMVPVSKKGKKGTPKKITHSPVPITAALMGRLMQVVDGRGKTAVALLKPSGEPWSKSDHSRLFARAAKASGLDQKEVTLYALRHSNIVRQLLAGIPIRVIAANHDTSVKMIEQSYSTHIGDHSDQIVRRALLDTGSPGMPSSKVVTINAGR